MYMANLVGPAEGVDIFEREGAKTGEIYEITANT